MSELEKELKQLRQTCLQMAQENAQLTSELENVQTAMLKITEQAIAAVQVTQLQDEFLKAIDATAEMQRLKAEIERLKGDEMADELNAEEAERHAAAEYRTMALFVDAVRVMRVMQNNYFATRDKSVLVMAKQFEAKVDNTIANDIFFVELLKKL